jgi:chemotaxis protein CheD
MSPRPKPTVPSAGATVQVVHPGGLALARRGETLETLLGSCVAVLLHDPEVRIGALCHIVHAGVPPEAARRQGSAVFQARVAAACQARPEALSAEQQALLTRPMPATAWAGPALFELHAMARAALRTQLATEGRAPDGPLPLRARVYGGGNMFPHLFAGHHVGMANVDEVLQRLAALGLPVVEQQTGGHGYRRLHWRVGPTAPRCEQVAPADAPA